MNYYLFIFKKFLLQHLEKILLFCMIALFAGNLIRLTTSFIHELGQTEAGLPSDEPSVSKNTPPIFSEEEYSTLVKTIQESGPEEKTAYRDLFSPKSEEAPRQGREKETLDSDHDGMPDNWESRFGLDPLDTQDASGDLDQDNYTNLDEYRGGSDPKDPNSFPGIIKMRVSKIYRQGTKINFFGYIQLPDSSFQFQINWGQQTAFSKVGEKIRGYKILEFTQASEKKFNTQINAEEEIDTSQIKIQKRKNPPMTLILGHPSFEKELYAVIQDNISGKQYVVHSGSKIHAYKVLDITPLKVVISRGKKVYTLERSEF
ncbi:MAG: hypothetical protein HYS08_08105 [Chlamydiae bacterium]|nr:hypothetical protein [Chlamydiota bacterium]MBI3266045.1 hypothetical protein [Chlamydiota bacterium]